VDKEKIKDLTEEQVRKAMACDTPEELVALAKAEGVELTKDEAEAYLSEMADVDLDSAQLKQVAGGYCNKCGKLKRDTFCNMRQYGTLL